MLLISSVVTAQPICTFVFAFEECCFIDAAAQTEVCHIISSNMSAPKNEPPCGKTNNLHRRKQRRRSASR